MRTLQNAFISALLLGLFGCATTPATESTAFDCAPKGYERFDGWELRDSRSGLASVTEDGQPIRVTSIGLSRGATEFLALTFVGHALIAVDTAPQDRNVPILLNTRYFTADDKLRSEPQGACGWRHPNTGREQA